MEERIIINDLVNKKWIQKMNEGDKTYYYHLHPDTANMLSRQLARLLEQTQPAQNQVA
jgi:predicted transcriptional regulator